MQSLPQKYKLLGGENLYITKHDTEDLKIGKLGGENFYFTKLATEDVQISKLGKENL